MDYENSFTTHDSDQFDYSGIFCEICGKEMKQFQINGNCYKCKKVSCTSCIDLKQCPECDNIFCDRCSYNTDTWEVCRECNNYSCISHFAAWGGEDSGMCKKCYEIMYKKRGLIIKEIIHNKHMVKMINDYTFVD